MNRRICKQKGADDEVTISKQAYMSLLESFCKTNPKDAALEIYSMFELLAEYENRIEKLERTQ